MADVMMMQSRISGTSSEERTWEVLIRREQLSRAGHILHPKWTCGSPAISPLNPICFVPSMASMHAKARPHITSLSGRPQARLKPAPSCVRQLCAHPLLVPVAPPPPKRPQLSCEL
ncbi:hypothetical protein GGI43DRAFT_27850 [Trichoderma evansii]